MQLSAKVQSSKYEVQNTKYKVHHCCGKKQMKAAEQQATNTLRGTLLLRMARLSGLSQSTEAHHPIRRLPAFILQV
jgi:hypothetical protein